MSEPQPSIPATAAEINERWLEAALSDRHPGVRVESIELLHRSEVTNAHARLVVRYRESAGAPEHLFAKLLPSEPQHRQAILQTKMGLREARFYEELAPKLDLRVPEIHVVRHDPKDGQFILVMEDLGTTGCTVSDGTQSVSRDAAARALEDLAGLHVRFEDPARRGAEAGWVPEPDAPSNYGVVRLREGLEHHRDRLSAAFAEMAELYIEEQAPLHALWHQGPHTVIHGDAHIGNLFDDGGRTGFLDWGLVVVTTPLRDLSYFLDMALSIEDRREHERDLIRHYLDVRRVLGGAPIDFDEAWKAHRLQTAYLAPACCQIVTFPEDASPRRKRFADAFLARAEAAIEDLESRAALRAFAGI
jgi:aminoglycoside phosphotransferase (APT) family kinase protein